MNDLPTSFSGKVNRTSKPQEANQGSDWSNRGRERWQQSNRGRRPYRKRGQGRGGRGGHWGNSRSRQQNKHQEHHNTHRERNDQNIVDPLNCLENPWAALEGHLANAGYEFSAVPPCWTNDRLVIKVPTPPTPKHMSYLRHCQLKETKGQPTYDSGKIEERGDSIHNYS